MLACRTQFQKTMNDTRYWHSSRLAVVRSRWLDVIAPKCTKLSACYAVFARQHKTGCTDEDLQNMTIASYNHVTYVPDAPSFCGVFAQVLLCKILRHHPRFFAVFPAPASTRPAGPRSSVDVDGVPGAPSAVPSDGVRPSLPSSAGDGCRTAAQEIGAGEAPVAVRIPGPMPSGSARSRDQAGLLVASTSMAERVKGMIEASSSEMHRLKNMERSMFFHMSGMRDAQVARNF